MPRSHRHRRATPLALGAIATLLLATACANGDDFSPASPSPATSSAPRSSEAAGALRITMENFAFSPADPEGRPGEKVTLLNKDSAAHTVTATDDDVFGTGNIAGGESGTFTAPPRPASTPSSAPSTRR